MSVFGSDFSFHGHIWGEGYSKQGLFKKEHLGNIKGPRVTSGTASFKQNTSQIYRYPLKLSIRPPIMQCITPSHGPGTSGKPVTTGVAGADNCAPAVVFGFPRNGPQLVLFYLIILK